jgi:hypothetical protein
MLRIGLTPTPNTPVSNTPSEEVNPNKPQQSAPSGADDMGGGREKRFSMDKVPQPNAGYMGPENGPFKCGNCDFFDPTDSDCHVVAGKVDAEGCCNMFTKLGAHQNDEGEEPDADDLGGVEDQEAPVSINAGR